MCQVDYYPCACFAHLHGKKGSKYETCWRKCNNNKQGGTIPINYALLSSVFSTNNLSFGLWAKTTRWYVKQGKNEKNVVNRSICWQKRPMPHPQENLRFNSVYKYFTTTVVAHCLLRCISLHCHERRKPKEKPAKHARGTSINTDDEDSSGS